MAERMMTQAERLQKIAEIKEMDEILKELDSRRFKKNFWLFNKEVMKWPDLYEPLHKTVCDFIQKNISTKKILLLLPRGCFKSSVVTVSYPLWRIAQNPNSRGLIANATYPMAVTFLGQIKDVLEKNEEYINIFGDLATGASTWKEDAIQVPTPDSYKAKDPTITAIGIESNYTGKHFDYAILDDLVNRDNIGTMDRINKVLSFYKDTLDLVDPDQNGHKPIIIIGTCWDQSDLYSWIQDKETGISDDFAVMKLPAFGEVINNDWVGEWGKGDLLFPTRLTWEVLHGLERQQGKSHFSAQYLLDPVPEDSATFKKFRYYEPSDLKGLQLNKFVLVDPAISESKEADYSAMVCIGVDNKNCWYILDLWRDKVNPKRLIDQIFNWDTKWKPITTGIESTAFQKVLRFFMTDEMKVRGHHLPIKELSHTERSKEDRIKGLEPRYEIGTVFHNKADPMTKYLEDELRRFPHAKNDDFSDALSFGLEVAFPVKKFEEREHSGYKSRYPA